MGWPRFENDVDVKWQRKDGQSYKLEAKLTKDAPLYLKFSDSEMLAVTDPSYQLKSSFGIDGTFLGGDLRITGKIDPYTYLDPKPKSVLMTAIVDEFSYLEDYDAGMGVFDYLVFGTTDINCPWFDFCTTTESVWIKLDTGGFSTALKRFDDTGFAVTTIPIPAAVWLFGSGILGLASIARRKRKIT